MGNSATLWETGQGQGLLDQRSHLPGGHGRREAPVQVRTESDGWFGGRSPLRVLVLLLGLLLLPKEVVLSSALLRTVSSRQ